MHRPVVTVTRRLPASVEHELAAEFDVRLNLVDEPLGESALAAALRASDGLLCTVTDRLDAAVLSVTPLRASILANFGVGHEHIDVAAAAARGVVVTNTPGVLTQATADLAIALMLMVARRAGEGERELRAGRWAGWRPTHMLGRDVSGRTLGIVGMGRIGRAVARRAQAAFGMRVIYTTRSSRPPADAGRRAASLEALLAESDFVSLHCPATAETRHLIDAARLALMSPHACLINSARGGIVDEDALADALESGMIAGAGLDVYEREPRVSKRLLALENVVLLPHLGSATVGAREAMGRRALDNLRAHFMGEPAPDRVLPPPAASAPPPPPP